MCTTMATVPAPSDAPCLIVDLATAAGKGDKPGRPRVPVARVHRTAYRDPPALTRADSAPARSPRTWRRRRTVNWHLLWRATARSMLIRLRELSRTVLLSAEGGVTIGAHCRRC